jgi:hypothetical protein
MMMEEEHDPFFLDDDEPRVVIIDNIKDDLQRPLAAGENDSFEEKEKYEQQLQKVEAEEEFYAELQRDLVEADADADDSDVVNGWWFYVSAIFLFVMFILVVAYLVSKIKNK